MIKSGYIFFNADNPAPDSFDWFRDVYGRAADGAFCEVCGDQISDNCQDLNGRCQDHTPDQLSPVLQRLVPLCLSIRTRYLSKLRESQANARSLESGVRTGPTGVRIMECTLFHMKCRLSMELGNELWTNLSQHPKQFSQVCEMEYLTRPFYGYRHWVFVITTSEGDYVFDPTGVQFGPEWPRLRKYDQYMSIHGRDGTPSPLRHPLGYALG